MKSENKWKVYEVKSSTSVSDANILDISVQYYIIENTAIEIKGISLVYSYNTYLS